MIFKINMIVFVKDINMICRMEDTHYDYDSSLCIGNSVSIPKEVLIDMKEKKLRVLDVDTDDDTLLVRIENTYADWWIPMKFVTRLNSIDSILIDKKLI